MTEPDLLTQHRIALENRERIITHLEEKIKTLNSDLHKLIEEWKSEGFDSFQYARQLRDVIERNK